MAIKIITLTQIAEANGINKKIARRRMRDAGIRRPRAGWVFVAGRRREIPTSASWLIAGAMSRRCHLR